MILVQNRICGLWFVPDLHKAGQNMINNKLDELKIIKHRSGGITGGSNS